MAGIPETLADTVPDKMPLLHKTSYEFYQRLRLALVMRITRECSCRSKAHKKRMRDTGQNRRGLGARRAAFLCARAEMHSGAIAGHAVCRWLLPREFGVLRPGI